MESAGLVRSRHSDKGDEMSKNRKEKNALYWKIGVASIILSVVFFVIAALLP